MFFKIGFEDVYRVIIGCSSDEDGFVFIYRFYFDNDYDVDIICLNFNCNLEKYEYVDCILCVVGILFLIFGEDLRFVEGCVVYVFCCFGILECVYGDSVV